MKKITLLFLLVFSISLHAQNKSDWKWRTKFAYSTPTKLSNNLKKTPAETYAHIKLEALEGDKDNIVKKVIVITEKQKADLSKMFIEQYPLFVASYDKYKESETTNSKIDLIKLLLKFEDDFREQLTNEQLILYKSYDPEKDFNANFLRYFMTEKNYYGYQKELL